MGGGGGGGGGGARWYPSPPRTSDAGARVDRAVSQAAAASTYDADANAYLQAQLSAYNDRDAAATQRHIETLKRAVEKEIDGETETLFGGSVRRHTYVDGLSDADVLMVVNNSSLADASPQQLLAHFEQRISDRLAGLGVEVKAGALAVTVKYADGTEIQVLPALRTATGIRIANAEGSGWSPVVRPQEFARKLTTVNQSLGGKVVPTIKLFKGLQTQLPSNDQLKGYHIESLAIEAFRNYEGRTTPKDMLRHLVRFASDRVRGPIVDTTGQSRHVDDYLGGAGSLERLRVSSALARLSNRLEAAERRGSLDGLKSEFGE